MLGNISILFVKYMREVTKGHLLGVSDYYVMYRQGPCQFCETSAKITSMVTYPFSYFCGFLTSFTHMLNAHICCHLTGQFGYCVMIVVYWD